MSFDVLLPLRKRTKGNKSIYSWKEAEVVAAQVLQFVRVAGRVEVLLLLQVVAASRRRRWNQRLNLPKQQRA